MSDKSTSVQVAVRIRPLNEIEDIEDSSMCISAVPGESQIRAGGASYFTFDHVFGPESAQVDIYDECVEDLLESAFEGFNATILAYGQTGSGKTFTMGSSSQQIMTEDLLGIIPRVIKNLFIKINQKEEEDSSNTYKVYVQFLEIYGEDIKDLLDQTKTSKVVIRETRHGEVFITGAREELVSSYEQMLKALEDGTKNRTTAATKMNQTSSRSHAIFTVYLENTVYSDVVKDQEINESDGNQVDSKKGPPSPQIIQEVRKSKFHFVDLAGSERAKRTGAQGQQLKEGIDINKGLLALGNVISALGDDQKKGKVYVPYRDSKLTRMLQDSLGGNSKTLMICCVSPAAINFNESVNALRYANRARNIKNKPIVNRDPTLLMIEDLRNTLKVIATELLELRKKTQSFEIDPRVTVKLLEDLINGASTSLKSDSVKEKPISRTSSTPNLNSIDQKSSTLKTPESKKPSTLATKKYEQEIIDLKGKLHESDFEIQRLTDSLKQIRHQAGEFTEQIYLARGERDYYKMKWSEACPEEASILDASINSSSDRENHHSQNPEVSVPISNVNKSVLLEEKKEFINLVSQHFREIDSLKKELATERSSLMQHEILHNEISPTELDVDFSSTIASLIAQTRAHLEEESRKLQLFEHSNKSQEELEDIHNILTQISPEDQSKKHIDEVEEEKAFVRRQKMLSSEVHELGQSIVLKEQLMTQLLKSQLQYNTMKSFYEQKLTYLSNEMQEKQSERDQLLLELKEISDKNSEAEFVKLRESKLKADLNKKDEELKAMKKKQDELRNLTHIQSQYSHQINHLETDITQMKKQRVDLTKTLNLERKNHMIALSEKAKEIEKLKKALQKASFEVKKLGKDKEIAENKVKDALREGAALKKKTQELMKLGNEEMNSTASTRAAIHAITKSSSRFSGRRILTEQELNTKKWIDQRIAEISAREAAAETLKKQYEQQLELLQRKEQLEKERLLTIEKSSKELNEEIPEGFKGPTPNYSDEEKLLEIIEERLSAINGQLHVRNQKISDIYRTIDEVGDIHGSEKAIEVLKRGAASTLPAAHELVRLLFDMLVYSNKELQHRRDQIYEIMEKEKLLQTKCNELQASLTTEQRNYDKELTLLNQSFEEKLGTLLQHISTLESEQNQNSSGPKSLDTITKHHLSSRKSFDPVELQFAIAVEENKVLKFQLERETNKYNEFHDKVIEYEKTIHHFTRDLEDKNLQIKFLEEDRALFKSMTEDLRAALSNFGKEGKLILQNVKDFALKRQDPFGAISSKSSSENPRGLFKAFLEISDSENEDYEDDTPSVLGEFENLAQEIFLTGSIHNTAIPLEKHLASHSNQHSSNPSIKGSSIYDRLTNPSNFTGHMKNVFENDLELKRQKIQKIRNHEKNTTNHHTKSFSSLSTHNLHGTTNSGGSNSSNSGMPPLSSSSPSGLNSLSKKPFDNVINDQEQDTDDTTRNYKKLDSDSNPLTISPEPSNPWNSSLSSTPTASDMTKAEKKRPTIAKTSSSRFLNEKEKDKFAYIVESQDDMLNDSNSSHNVFSRLSSHLTGIHKHKSENLNLNVSSPVNQTSAPARYNSPASNPKTTI